VLPIENSLGGSIHTVYDLLVRYRLHIVGETSVAVNHCLLALPGTKKEDLVRVMSHPQVCAWAAGATGGVAADMPQGKRGWGAGSWLRKGRIWALQQGRCVVVYRRAASCATGMPGYVVGVCHSSSLLLAVQRAIVPAVDEDWLLQPANE
jgi:hypothetical protein